VSALQLGQGRVDLIATGHTTLAVEVRRIRADDWRSLRDIRLRALNTDPYAFGASLDAEQAKDDNWWKEWADEGSRSDDWATFIAEEGGRWIGLVGCFREDDDKQAAKIFTMWVEPDARRAGVARQLLETTERWLVDRGVRETRLSVSDAAEAAQHLYEHHGYTATGETRPLSSNPSLKEIDMQRILSVGRPPAR
jgi:ribosomal protein S18 acetylase RimI-like enzyme